MDTTLAVERVGELGLAQTRTAFGRLLKGFKDTYPGICGPSHPHPRRHFGGSGGQRKPNLFEWEVTRGW